MQQPVPTVTAEDVRRIAERDFGSEKLEAVLSELDKFGQQPWNQHRERVQLAILKMAGGDEDRLRQALQIAIADARDVLAAAEYPRYTLEIGFRETDQGFKEAVINDDWAQYRTWLLSETGV